jgi:hypothetical protein
MSGVVLTSVILLAIMMFVALFEVFLHGEESWLKRLVNGDHGAGNLTIIYFCLDTAIFAIYLRAFQSSTSDFANGATLP